MAEDTSIFPPTFFQNPYPFYAQLRAAGPVVPLPDGRVLITSHRHASAALADRRLRVKKLWGEEQGISGPTATADRRMMVNLDPPDHTRLRGLVSRVFTPRYIAALEPQIQRIADGLIDTALQHTSFDLIESLAYPLPITVIAAMLGLPAEDHDQFRRWAQQVVYAIIQARMAPSADQVPRDVLAEADTVMTALREYLSVRAAERAAAPRDDLLSALVAVRDQNDRLSDDELISMCLLLIIAGHETTMNLIGNGVLALLTHPDQLALLRAQPELIDSAVSELLRFDSPAQIALREIPEPISLEEVELRAGSEALILLGSAHRDPARYEDPDRLDIRRAQIDPLMFGAGIHYCLGAHLARLETRVAIGTLLRRAPALALAPGLDPDALEWNPTLILRGLVRLPVVA
ncbi:MAG TPA: cytochrome P450 [Roseiflexaceae bacterium]|nr:cytochrome P450 [Roseiflexaceae bacterium]